MELTFIGKPDCHLCEVAWDEVRSVVGELESQGRLPRDFTIVQRSLFDDPALVEKYAEEIPVVLLDGAVHTIWRVKRERLRDAIIGVES